MAKKTPARGQIWHTNGDPISGREFQGAHYYLVISDGELNRQLGTSMCVPITSGGLLARSTGVTVVIDGSSTDKGNVTGVALCYQIRALDLESRNATYSSKVTPEILDEVIQNIVNLVDPSN
ncbi:type II toxin-antitoxin system PemK/MazF family toxin [Providencia alcalifaciens]|uniref:type II toxin-antitoxin system PemK/MazF family toxin n=1 Tax=Providencia alcalifaciens TaxID=126385 RepID=UPI002B055CD6|nr:type II toxin-antitoxin system PemK/MazF family toxin [Providencia alcalifaciens]